MHAVERQHADCMAIIQQRGWELVGEYSDNSVSASKRATSRPEYNRMVDDFAAGSFDAVVCWDLDRLTRQPRQLEDWIDAATERGLKLTTANGEADLSTDGGRLFARIKAAVAREEIERKGARQKSAARQRVAAGGMASFKPCYGYTSTNVIVEAEAAVVRHLFERFALGETVYSLTQALKGTTSRPKQSAVWSRSSVRGILTNPRYAARVVHHGAVASTAGTWKAIIAPGLFDTVQAIMSDPRRITNRIGTARRHLLSGMALCGVCGSTVRGSGETYVCPNFCVTKALVKTDALVMGAARGRLAQLGTLDLSRTSNDPRLDALAVELRGRLATIEADYDAGLIDGRRYAAANDKVQAELLAVDTQRRSKTGKAAAATVLSASDPVEAFESGSLAIRRAVIGELMTITVLKRATHGGGQFDPETVRIEWTPGAAK
jgi:DNA invertase Pin-like site-specific DNA recombinase